jgi:hypothetical protein
MPGFPLRPNLLPTLFLFNFALDECSVLESTVLNSAASWLLESITRLPLRTSSDFIYTMVVPWVSIPGAPARLKWYVCFLDFLALLFLRTVLKRFFLGVIR